VQVNPQNPQTGAAIAADDVIRSGRGDPAHTDGDPVCAVRSCFTMISAGLETDRCGAAGWNGLATWSNGIEQPIDIVRVKTPTRYASASMTLALRLDLILLLVSALGVGFLLGYSVRAMISRRRRQVATLPAGGFTRRNAVASRTPRLGSSLRPGRRSGRGKVAGEKCSVEPFC
jgi:hypothetical protein